MRSSKSMTAHDMLRHSRNYTGWSGKRGGIGRNIDLFLSPTHATNITSSSIIFLLIRHFQTTINSSRRNTPWTRRQNQNTSRKTAPTYYSTARSKVSRSLLENGSSASDTGGLANTCN
ncbi:hypothetical protein CEXT_37111 [Caerostris extrusa]|uniref:Uncharacterized protein n=1 Tax=Caerostris extrusa TaxID=172846 RepID=A0AAV4YDY0_CAEEX|nr:hypothetical protein CEXT_37111 [Caerostris extrusa]